MSNPFKVGDRVRVIIGLGFRLIYGEVYNISRITQNGNYIYVYGVEGGWTPERFELVNSKNSIKFEVWEWSEWVEDIISRIKGASMNEITVDNLIHAPKLDPEDPRPFCKSFMFDGIYENKIFVRHHIDRDSYWFINSGDTSLVYKNQS
jgi:hypothetical protein